jgi:MurNAc alpha-1-phosphate uridylyltransferase
MILAAGRGERMRPLTDTVPKPLLEAGGKPLIAWHLENLARAGVAEVVINHAHLGHMIEAALGDGAAFGLRIRYSPEREALETAGGIAQALTWLGDGPFLVVNGDVFCDLEFSLLNEARDALSGDDRLLAHLVLVDNPPHHPRGDFALLRDGRAAADAEPRLAYSGIGVYRAALFAGVVPGSRARLAPLLVDAMRAGRISARYHGGFWLDVGTPARLAELDARLRAR